MEIHSNSLLVGLLLACSIPLLLMSLLTLAFFTTRSRIRDAKIIRSSPQEYKIYNLLKDDRARALLRVLAGLALICILILLTSFLLFLYWLFKPLEINAWVTLSVIVTAICSFLFGVLLLYLGRKALFKK